MCMCVCVAYCLSAYNRQKKMHVLISHTLNSSGQFYCIEKIFF